ncbi:MAG: PspC domain-containing protein [Paludibacteraceae bacterium]|nr:PspC domain-containing protein [Paludibacteraceae bacterium]
MSHEPKKLYRSNNRMIGGVCAGLAEYFDIDATLVRVVYAALSLFSACFPGVLLYIILLIIVPNRENYDREY